MGNDLLRNVSHIHLNVGHETNSSFRVATILALLLDINTLRTEHRLGIYKAPEDDQATQHVHDMKTVRVRSEGYSAPDEQIDHISPTWKAPEEDITYRGTSFAESTRGPLDGHGSSAGYRDH